MFVTVTAGASTLKAQTKATTQPTTVQPRKMFRTAIAPAFRFFLTTAMIVGAKYGTTAMTSNIKRCRMLSSMHRPHFVGFCLRELMESYRGRTVSATRKFTWGGCQSL